LERGAFEGGDVAVERVASSRVLAWKHHDVPPEPWAWFAGPFTVVTDLPEGEIVPREEYRLLSSDGEFDSVLAIPDDAIVEGLQLLRFYAVPVEKNYSLTVRVHDGEPITLFSDIPYNELHHPPQEANSDEEGI
jgi:hypothetical protein